MSGVLTIVQANVRSFFNIRNIFYDFLDRECPDVVLLNSTSITNSYAIKHFGYTSRQSRNGWFVGSCILVKSTLHFEFISPPFIHPDFMAVKLFTQQGPIMIATAYIRPNSNLPLSDFNKLFSYNNLPVFFAGDVNASHISLHHTTTNAHGRQLLSIFNTKRLHYIGPDFHTTITARGKGRPDLVFGNRAALPYHTHLQPGPNIGSDHIPVIIKLSTSPIHNKETPSFRYKKADWNDFKSYLSDQNFDFNLDRENVLEIDRHWHHLFAWISAAMLRSIPRERYKIRKSFHPSERTKRLLTCYRNRFLQNIQNLHRVRWDLTILRNHVIDSFDNDRKIHWQNLINQTESMRVRNPREFWQKIKQLKGSNFPPFSHLLKDNTQVSDPVDVIKIFRDHWQTVFYPHEPHPFFNEHFQSINTWSQEHRIETEPEPIIHMDRLDDTCELRAPILLEEIKQIIKRFPRKAPGFSQIGRDALLHLPDNVLRAMTHLYNTSLASGYFPAPFKTAIVALIPKPNKDLTDPKNYRPISLLETLGKIFERVINSRLRRYLDDHDLLSSKQFGFRSHRSTTDALNLLTNYCLNNKDRRLKTVLVTKDVERAFDTVWHAGLKYKICTKFNFPSCTKKLLCSFLDDRKLKLKFKGKVSSTINMHAGVPQGSIISPTLYILYTNDLPDPTFPDSLTLLYADDCTHLARHDSLAGVVRRINDELDTVSRWEHKWLIKTNSTKTKVLFINPRHNPPYDPIYLNSFDRLQAPLQITHSCTVLGVTFDTMFRFHYHTSSKAALARKTLQSLYRFRCAASRTKLHLLKALITPLLTYAPLTLTLAAQTNRRKLQIVLNKALRWVYSVAWDDFVSTARLHERAAVLPLNLVWRWMICKQLDKLRAWCPDWIERSSAFIQGRRSGIGRDLFSLDWSEEIEPAF